MDEKKVAATRTTTRYIRKVNYYETDRMNIVHHSNYARYLEESRFHLMAEFGIPYDELEERGVIIPVLELHDYYIKSVKFGDVIEVEPEIIKLTPVRFRVRYTIYKSGTDEVLHRAETSHAFLDADFVPMNLKKRFPDVYKVFEDAVVTAKSEE